MNKVLALGFASAVLLLSAPAARAVPIALTLYESSVDAGGGVGTINLPQYVPVIFNADAQGGGTITFEAGALGPLSYGTDGTTTKDYPITGTFHLNIAVPGPSSSQAFASPEVEVSGPISGTISGPGYGGTPWRWSGGYSGTATSAALDTAYVTDDSQLPAALKDLLTHPERLHVSLSVGGGSRNTLDMTLTIDPPTEAPEPTALATLAAGAALLAYRRRVAKR